MPGWTIPLHGEELLFQDERYYVCSVPKLMPNGSQLNVAVFKVSVICSIDDDDNLSSKLLFAPYQCYVHVWTTEASHSCDRGRGIFAAHAVGCTRSLRLFWFVITCLASFQALLTALEIELFQFSYTNRYEREKIPATKILFSAPNILFTVLQSTR